VKGQVGEPAGMSWNHKDGIRLFDDEVAFAEKREEGVQHSLQEKDSNAGEHLLNGRISHSLGGREDRQRRTEAQSTLRGL